MNLDLPLHFFLSKQILVLFAGDFPMFMFKSISEQMMTHIYNNPAKTPELKRFYKMYEPLMGQILMWGWEVYRLQGNMMAYFSEAEATEKIIFYTLDYLWK